MAAQHSDKLVRSFLTGSNPSGVTPAGLNVFDGIQDPTYMSFKLDFFPDGGNSYPDDLYSSGGLFRKIASGNSPDTYSLNDSAAEYLARIGSPMRQQYLEIFISLLSKLQENAPWYFQSITGLGDLYKIDPAMNFRGKDKVLSIECLESIDLRMTLLADLYRNLAFEVEGMREVLPINLRTFSMKVHVLEFRKFNTTFGVIADALSSPTRITKGQDRQQENLDSQSRNVFANSSSSLFNGTFNNGVANDLNTKLGGMFNSGGSQNGDDSLGNLKSAFNAVSVQTFLLKDCEFDFFSESPGYLDTVSVADSQAATSKFKIKVGKIQSATTYSFYDYVIAEYAKNSQIPGAAVDAAKNYTGRQMTTSLPYFEEIEPRENVNFGTISDLEDSIYPRAESATSSYIKQSKDSAKLRSTPLERLVGGLLQNATSAINSEINQTLGNLTGGILGTASLGSVYDNITNALNEFLPPENTLSSDNLASTNPNEVLSNIKFDALNTPSFTKKNVFN